MTVKEIAGAVGKDERSVRRWVEKLADKMSVIADKMSVSSPMKPADYTLDETCAIIEEGMGVDVAAVFRENAQKQNVVVESKGHQVMAELRRAFDRGLISADEYRAGVGLKYPKADMLDPAIAKQVYAVTMKAIEKKQQQLLLEQQNRELF